MSSYQTALNNETLATRSDVDAGNLSVCSEMTDRQLVDLTLAGDNFAFEQIFDRHKRLVAVIAARCFRKPDEIEDIVQISFARSFTQLDKFRGEHDRSLASWLIRITANICFDTLRAQKRKPETLTCDLSDAEVDSLVELTADTSRSQERSLVAADLSEKLLAQLPIEERALLQMLYSEEMSVAEIADVLDCTAANVKIRAWRARKTLRKLLQKIL
ncbi:MAG: sigma-70 family RNA polymerase sigma factor [Chloracidobacterium sp.]|nr:sigma-70 family RNA polymerase sigma factor [Chloracidobacterium sp.]